MKLIISDYKINSESCFFISIKSQLILNWYIELLQEINFKEAIFCTEKVDLVKQFIEKRLGYCPRIQVVRSIPPATSKTLMLKADYIYDKRKLIKLIKREITDFSSAILWKIKNRSDIKNTEMLLDRIENFPVAKYINLKIGKRLADFLVNTRCRPNQLTFAGLVIGMLACFCFAIGAYAFSIVGVFLLQLYCTLDFADGHLARLKNMNSQIGAFWDGIVNRIVEPFCYAGISYGLFIKYNNKAFFLLALLVILGHSIIEYMNFLKRQYLKSTFIPAYQIDNKKLPFKILKRIHWFVEQWDVRFYIISFFAILDKLEIALIYFAIDFNIRWIFNLVKIIARYPKNL